MKYYKKRFRVVIMVFASLLIPLMMWGCSDVNTPSTTGQTNPNPKELNPVGTIQGKLVDSVTLQPISGAIIDIAVGKATTTETGQFKIENVPATTDPTNEDTVSGSYQATIDLRDVNKAIDAENKKIDDENKKIEAANAKLPEGSTPTPLKAKKAKYPEFSYASVQVKFTSLQESDQLDVAESQHDTPVDKLIAPMDLSVGKLDANIEGVVAGCSGNGNDFFTPVGEGYTVKLYTASSSNTTASGANGHLIGQTTTDASGNYSFSNVEAKLYVTIVAENPDGTLEGFTGATTPADGETLKLTDIQQSVAIHVCSNDIHGPEIVSVSPEVGSDQTPGSISVELTFSEAVKQTAATGTDTSGVNNLYDNIEVMYDGTKAGNVHYSLAWNSTFDKLTVTITSTGTSSLYHVRLLNIDEVFEDANGETAVLGECPDDEDVPASYGLTADPNPEVIDDGIGNDDGTCDSGEACRPNDCTVYFTTKGGTTPGKPSVTVVNASSLGEGESTEVILNWNQVSGAKEYNVYCTPIQVWQVGETTTPQSGTTILVDTVSDSQATVDVLTFVENGDVKLKYECFVRGVNSDGVEGPDSNKVTGEDTLGPELVDISDWGDDGSLVCPDTDATTCDVDNMITDITLYFSELLNSDSAQTTANYTIYVATGTVPTVSGAVYDSSGPSVRLTLSSPLDPANLNPSTIGPGDNGVLDSLDVSGNAAGDDEVTRPDCVTGGTGFLDTSTAGDDEVVGNSINVGPDGVCDSTAAGDDTQALTAGNGQANSICITAGPNGFLNSTPSSGGDDTVSGTNILSGSNGVCDAPVIGPGTNGVINSTAAGDDEVTRPTCVTAGTNGFLDTSDADDDVVVGNSINVGADGICDSTASGDDTQVLTVGNGQANSICITAGNNGFLNTMPSSNGDDTVSGTNILSGSNGVCDAPVIGPGTNGVINSTAAGDDVLVRPTCINPGADRYLQTSTSGDDTIVTNTTSGNSINVGVNGICDTAILGGSDDVQVLTQTKGTVNSICITPGSNSILNTTAAGTDSVSGSNILSGTDTTCETTATGDDVQNIAVGRSLSSLYITAGPNLVRNTTVAGDDVVTGERAVDDIQNIPVGEGLDGTLISAGDNLVLDTTTVAGDDVVTGERAVDDIQNIPVGEGLNGTLISAGDNLVLDTTVDDEDVLVGGKAVTVSGVKDVGGTTIRSTADQYNTDGSVE